MKKIKEWWLKAINASVLWFVIPVFIIVIVPTLWYTRPLLNLSLDDIEIYRLSTTILGITAAIGTLINSARSSKSSSESVRISAESIRITKDKEAREQSPHLIVLSESLEIPVIPPMYRKKFENQYPDVRSFRRHPKEFYKQLAEYRDRKTNEIEHITTRNMKDLKKYETAIQEFRNYMEEAIKNTLNYGETEHFISVLNSGKGTAVNIEYEFIFENYKEFSMYSFNSTYDLLAPTGIPNYSISVENMIDKIDGTPPIINIKDLQISEDISHVSSYFGKDEAYFPISNRNIVYLNAITSGEAHQFPIPNSFSALAKHYMIYKHFQKIYDDNSFKFSERVLNLFKKEKAILPKGRVIIRYADDELARTDNNKKNKIELNYDISFKETDLVFFKNTISNVYLEAEYISAEKT